MKLYYFRILLLFFLIIIIFGFISQLIWINKHWPIESKPLITNWNNINWSSSLLSSSKLSLSTTKAIKMNDVIISIIIPTYGINKKKLYKTITSIISQDVFIQTEIIIINDGYSESLFRSFVNEYNAKYPPDEVEIMENYDGKVGGQYVRFLSNPEHEGIGGARNFGISHARGIWVQMMNENDELQSSYYKEILSTINLQSSNSSLLNPGRINVIITDVDIDKDALKAKQLIANVVKFPHSDNFHCCGMVLKLVFDSGLVYSNLIPDGWEDYDFWIRMDSLYGIEAMFVEKPLYIIGGNDEKKALHSVDHLSKYCKDHGNVCNSFLQLHNPCSYDKIEVLKSFEVVYDHIKQTKEIPKKELVEKEGIKGNLFAQQLLEMKTHSAETAPMNALKKYYDNRHCDKCQESISLVQNLADHQDQEAEMSLFHMIIVTPGSDSIWGKMLRHAVVGILDNNINAKLVVHTDLKMSQVFDFKFWLYYKNRILLFPLHCHSVVAAMNKMTDIDKNVVNRFGDGQFYYYSHFKDYARLLILYSFGGIYLDTDVILRKSVTHLQNSISQADDDYINGALMSFSRHSPLMKTCLDNINTVYDSLHWNTNGPNWISIMKKKESNTSDSKFNVLQNGVFYHTSWENMNGLVSVQVPVDEYERKSEHLGYHFYGKAFYSKMYSIESTSLLGHALQSTCRPSIMACIELV